MLRTTLRREPLIQTSSSQHVISSIDVTWELVRDANFMLYLKHTEPESPEHKAAI